MPKYRFEETLAVYVTFKREIEAATEAEAHELWEEGEGTELPHEMGDNIDSWPGSLRVEQIA